MNYQQLRCAVEEDVSLKSVVTDIYASDVLPTFVQSYPSAYICNTDPSSKPGQHWVAFWFTNSRELEFYDSLGQSPEFYNSHFVRFIENNTETCVYNNVSVQRKHSDKCGYHVLYFLLVKCRGFNMSDIVIFLQKCIFPDKYVYEIVSMYFSCI